MKEKTPEMYDMNFRDYVAVAAMQALIQSMPTAAPPAIVKTAYRFAGYMTKEREVQS